MSAALAEVPSRARFAVVCFGYERERVRRQPWHIARGMAQGLTDLGHDVTLLTDALQPPAPVGHRIERVDRLFERGRATDALRSALARFAPSRIFLITGARELARLEPLRFPAPTGLVIASPRFRPGEILRMGARALWRERRLLALPILNALLPGMLLRAGFTRSGAADVIYLSRAAQDRYAARHLPRGQLLLPQVDLGICADLPPPPAGTPRIVYFGPPLALRGADLAIEAFEAAVAAGLDADLELLLRPDEGPDGCKRLQTRAARSPARSRIWIETRLLSMEELRIRLASANAFLLPFLLPVSEVPLVVLEAGLSGRPVVVLDAPGVSEYARALGGIVAAEPKALPQALIDACGRPAAATPFGVEPWTRWDRAVAPLVEARPTRLERLRLVAIAGVDGSGKTTLIEALRARLAGRGIRSRHVWSRFRNYTSKPLLALARLTGHNRKEQHDGFKVGYHDFTGTAYALPFILLQLLDNWLDINFRFRRPGLTLSDRCVLDTIVDLAVDTGQDELLIERVGPWLARQLPRPLAAVVVTRSAATIAGQRPDAVADRHFARRRALYLRLADRLGIPVVGNDSTIDATIDAILEAIESGAAELGPDR